MSKHPMSDDDQQAWKDAFSSTSATIKIAQNKKLNTTLSLTRTLDQSGPKICLEILQSAQSIRGNMPLNMKNPFTGLSGTWDSRDVDFVKKVIKLQEIDDNPVAFKARIEALSPTFIEATVQQFLSIAIYRKNYHFFEKLIDMGFHFGAPYRIDHSFANEKEHPHQEAIFKAVDFDDKKGSLLWAALMSDSEDIFNLLLRMPRVMESAKNNADSPWVFQAVAVKNIIMMHKMGIPIDGCDKEGNNILHIWGLLDGSPRNGWPLLMKTMPGLLTMKNKKGQTPFEVATAHKTQSSKVIFERMISEFEQNSLKTIVSKTPAPVAPKNTTRI